MKEFTVTKNDAGQRLDRFVGKAVKLPEALLQKYIRLKRIKINGRGAPRDTRLNHGDVIQMYINDEFFEKPSEENAYLKITSPRLEIVYEDENLLLADKKPGMLCHGDESGYNTLIANIQAHAYITGDWVPKQENSFAPALCNRIDRNTGGIVIAAKTAEAIRIINRKIKDREIDKYYICAVHGKPSPPAGRLTGYLSKDEAENRVFVSKSPAPGAKIAVTEYKTLCEKGKLSLLECRLVTGRTHQIRAQMAFFGHPLLGDGKYGTLRLNKEYDERFQALYSYKIAFSFETDAGALNYLKGKAFSVSNVDFVEKYFDIGFLD